MADYEFFEYVDRTPREILGFVKNSWLYQYEIRKARRLSGDGSDKECADYLAHLRKQAAHRLGMWRWSQ